MKLSYSNFEHRWMALHVEADFVDYTLDASSILNDFVLDLVNAVIRLRKRSKTEYVVFWEEPSSFVWQLRKDGDRVFVDRYFVKDYQPVYDFLKKHLNKAEFLDTFETDLKTLTNCVIAFVSRLQDDPGIEKYEEAWGRVFPSNELKALIGLRWAAQRDRKKSFDGVISPDSPFAKAMKLLQTLFADGVVTPEPGLSREFLETICTETNTVLPPLLAEWLTYCNGISSMQFGELYGFGDGCSEFTAHWKNRGWTAVAGDGCGSNYLVVKVETRDGSLYPVVFADHAASVIEENGEKQLCNCISYIVASDLPHFLEAIFLNELHLQEHPDHDDDEYLNFWWPFDKERVRRFDLEIEKAGIITPWAANVESILNGLDWLFQKGDRKEARNSLLRAVEEAREKTWVSGEMCNTIELMAENGFIRDTLKTIRSLPPSYERSHSICYVTFSKSEHFDCSPEEAVETTLAITEEGFNMLDDELPPERCDRYFAHYVDNVTVLINIFAERRGLKNSEKYLDRLQFLVEKLTDPMDRILSLLPISGAYCDHSDFDTAEKLINEADSLVEQAPDDFWSEWNFYHDDPLTYENVHGWVENVKNAIMEARSNMVTLEKIVRGSNEAKIQELVLHNNCLTVKAILPNYGDSNYGVNGSPPHDEITVTLKIKANVFDVQIPDTMPLAAHFRLDRIVEGIKANSWGYYIPSDQKDEFFWSIKNGFALAFGRYFQKYGWLFRIVFAEGHVNILLSDPSDIEFAVEETD